MSSRFVLNELSRLLAGKSAAGAGVVVALTEGVATVATPSGSVRAEADAGVRVGARVRIVGGKAVRAASPTQQFQV